MKPTKNRVYCPDCGRVKMLFETEKKAQGFIRFNEDEIEMPEGCSLRAYHCVACGGWHITHKRYRSGYGQLTELIIEQYREFGRQREEAREMRRLMRVEANEQKRAMRELALVAKAERMVC